MKNGENAVALRNVTLEEIRNSLFSREHNRSLHDAYLLMVNGEPDENVLKRFYGNDYNETASVARALMVRAAYEDENTNLSYRIQELNTFFDCLVALLTNNNDQIKMGFVLGVSLSIFETMVWFDERETWIIGEKFKKEGHRETRKRSIVSLATAENGPIKTVIPDHWQNTDFENRMSVAIKKWVQGPEFYRGERFADIQDVINRINEKFYKHSDGDILPLPKMICDQLTFKLFNSISTTGRILAANLFFDDLLRFPKPAKPIVE